MRESFGKLTDGREASLFILKNKNGMEIAVTDLGASLVQVKIADCQGQIKDVVLGYDTAADYEAGTESFGGTVGRFANRLANGEFTIDGKSYSLTTNNGPNALHGGRDFYVHRLWTVEVEEENQVKFSLISEDGDQGFPGTMRIAVTYTLTEENEVLIHYDAVSDQDTPMNLTNHSYFNLGGHKSGSILSHKVSIQAHQLTETDENSLPNGKILDVAGTPMDFLTEKELGKDIEEEFEALRIGNGYDHNYMVDGEGYRQVAVARCEETGIVMTVKSDLPGVQVYTANYLNNEKGKNGAVYQAREGVCFETQFYPDAVNREEFPGGILKAGEAFSSTTCYQFTVEK